MGVFVIVIFPFQIVTRIIHFFSQTRLVFTTHPNATTAVYMETSR